MPGVIGIVLMASTEVVIQRECIDAVRNSFQALVIGVRHESAPFAFTDAMWSKHGVVLSKRAKFVDPKTNQPAMTNIYQTRISNLTMRGVQISICDMSSHAIAGLIAESIGGKADEVYPQLIANRVDNGHQVPAGIVAVNRAQERGYSKM